MFQFLVPVNAECDNINVNVCVPDAELNGNEMHKDLVFQRSESSLYINFQKFIAFIYTSDLI